MKMNEILLLLRRYGRIMRRLRLAGIIRSGNNPAGDFAEYLVAKKFGLDLTPNSNKSYDAIHPKLKKRYQVKARRVTQFNKSKLLSVIRSFEFDFLVAVIFNEDFTVHEAFLIPATIARRYSKTNKHQNGYILDLRAVTKDKAVKRIRL